MENKIETFFGKVLKANFKGCVFKYTYLYNEFYISIFDNDKQDFLLFGILYKSNKLKINKYRFNNLSNGNKLLAIIKKYDDFLIKLLEKSKNMLFNIGDESEFINIYDKQDLEYEDIKNILYFNFIDDYTYRRRGEMDFNFESKSILDIYHSDFECSKCDGPVESFTNFPKYRDNKIDKKYFKDNSDNEKESTHLVTNITDYESITIGGNEKINDILKDKKFISNFDLISINKTCISEIMGDDIKSILKYNNIDSSKTIYTDQSTDSGYRTTINFLKNIKLNIKVNKNNEVIFFGINKNKNTYELIKFIENNLGIKVGNVLLPNININDLEDILKYDLAVFFMGKEIKAQNIFKLYPLENFDLVVPYGITNVKTLCEELISRLNININLQSIFDSIVEDNKEVYNKAKKYNIGFIIHDFHIKNFLLDNFRGISILSMLNDMGFGIKFFIKNNHKYSEDINELQKEKYDIMLSDNKFDLDNFIKNKDIQLYYSEINNDVRILDNNKAQFSIGDLEYGIEGFYRTFDILLKKCEKVDYYNNLLKNEG